MSEPIGDLVVNVTGDYSELQSALDQAESTAASAGSAIAQSFESAANATELAGGALSIFQQALNSLRGDGETLAQALDLISQSASTMGEDVAKAAQELLDGMKPALDNVGEAAGTAGDQLDHLTPATEHAGEAAHTAELGFAGMAESLVAIGEALVITEALKELIEKSIEVYGETQQVAVSFQLLGASAEEAQAHIEELQHMSLTLAVPMEQLEATARRLAVSFQDVKGIDLDQVLTSAANAAALTGRSFDAVASALQRVELTGAVTNRQLVQLGLSWQQLADTMGVSIEQAQSLLKKGGQDAVTDLQAVLATIQSVSGDAAKAQAQTVLGQFTILSNETKILFDNIGQLIAPIVLEITSGLQTLVTVASEAVNEFEQLPAPLQDIGIAIAGLSVGIPAAALALGGLGLSIAGIQKLLPAVTEGLAAMGIEAEGLGAAIGAIGIPVAAVFGAIAAWIATAKITGLTDDFSHLGDVISTVGKTATDAFEGVKPELEVTAQTADTVIEAFTGISGAVEKLQSYFTADNWMNSFIQAATPAFQILKVAVEEMTQELAIGAAAVLAATGHNAEAMQVLAAATGKAKQATVEYIDEAEGEEAIETSTGAAVTAHAAAHDELAKAATASGASITAVKAALDDAKKAYEDGTGSLQAVEKAQLAYNESLKASVAPLQAEKGSLEQIAQSLASASSSMTNAQATVAKLNQALEEGKTELGGFNIQAELLPAAINAAAVATKAYQIAIDGGKSSTTAFIATASEAYTKIGELAKTWTELVDAADQTPIAAAAADNALKQLQSTAKQMGIEVTVVGDQLRAAVVDGSKASADSIQELIDKISLFNQEMPDTILVNGKAVQTLQDLAAQANETGKQIDSLGFSVKTTSDGIVVLKGASDSAAQSFESNSTSAYTLDEAMSKLQDTLQKEAAASIAAGNASYDTQLQLLNEAAAADKDAAAFNNLANAKSKASGGKGGKGSAGSGGTGPGGWGSAADAANLGAQDMTGGSMGLVQYLEMALQMASDPIMGGGVGMDIVDKMAQELADLTGQTVKTPDGEFQPAAQAQAALAANLATYKANQQAKASAGSSSSSPSTSASSASSSVGSSASTSLTNLASAADLATQALLALSNAAGTSGGSADAGAALVQLAASSGLNVNASAAQTAATQAQTAALQAAAAATATYTAQTITKGQDLSAYGPVQGSAPNSTYSPATITKGADLGQYGPALPPIQSPYAPSSASKGVPSWQYVDPNSFAGFGSGPGKFEYPNQGGGTPNVQINITGNTVASDQSIKQLANAVASAFTTGLRTNSSLKTF